MTAHDFTRAQLRHVNALCGSSQMVAFVERMNLDSPAIRLVREFGNYAIAMRPTWSRIDALHAKCDDLTITATEALELLALERSQA